MSIPENFPATTTTAIEPFDPNEWTVQFKKLVPEAVIPKRAKAGDAGLDLAILNDAWVDPGHTVRIGTGLACAIPVGFVGRIHPRSSMFFKGLDLDGVIDAGYRGELLLQVRNSSNEPVKLSAGERVAQMLVQPVYIGRVVEVTELPPSERGVAGFGSTGT